MARKTSYKISKEDENEKIKKYKLEPVEKETIINFNEETDECTIYSASKIVITKCKRAGYEIIEEDSFGGVTFRCSSNKITFGKNERKPRATKPKTKKTPPSDC